MACPTVLTGQAFLGTALAHIDCQAQTIGSYGFAALASQGSPVSIALTSLLTVFIALFGIRLLLGYSMTTRDVVGDVLKVGIVLTLATSWPAWRIVGYDLLIHGPGQIAEVIGAGAALPGSGGDMSERLQNVDNGLAAFTVFGSGRPGVAQGDWFQLGLARSAYLAGTLIPLALVRLTAGFLLAVAPLMAGLLLFGVTRAIFEGWARALVLCFLGSIMLTLIHGVELALLEPWLQDALQRRASDMQTLDAPVEVLVLTLAFPLVALAALFLVARLAFHGQYLPTPSTRGEGGEVDPSLIERPRVNAARDQDAPRAVLVADAVAGSLRREERIADIMRVQARASGDERAAPSALAARSGVHEQAEALGSTWRRPARRASGAARRRDGK